MLVHSASLCSPLSLWCCTRAVGNEEMSFIGQRRWKIVSCLYLEPINCAWMNCSITVTDINYTSSPRLAHSRRLILHNSKNNISQRPRRNNGNLTEQRAFAPFTYMLVHLSDRNSCCYKFFRLSRSTLRELGARKRSFFGKGRKKLRNVFRKKSICEILFLTEAHVSEGKYKLLKHAGQ